MQSHKTSLSPPPPPPPPPPAPRANVFCFFSPERERVKRENKKKMTVLILDFFRFSSCPNNPGFSCMVGAEMVIGKGCSRRADASVAGRARRDSAPSTDSEGLRRMSICRLISLAAAALSLPATRAQSCHGIRGDGRERSADLMFAGTKNNGTIVSWGA